MSDADDSYEAKREAAIRRLVAHWKTVPEMQKIIADQSLTDERLVLSAGVIVDAMTCDQCKAGLAHEHGEGSKH